MRREFIIILVLVLGAWAQATIVTISDVEINPELPSAIDVITIEVRCNFSDIGVEFDESVFTSSDFSLQLDLFFTDAFGPMIPGFGDYDKEIGALQEGIYDLFVQAYWRNAPEYEYILHDSCSAEFTVIPEPATILLFGLGGIGLKRSLG